MALPESTLSIACNAVSQFLRDALSTFSNNIKVTLGAPAAITRGETQHCINLFFYRFEPSGYQSAVRPDEIRQFKLFCLITTIGVDEDDIAAGENELRMLGEVVRVFHEQPILDLLDVSQQQVRLQAVFNPISDEQINQLWSTQGDTAYRPSVIYELALMPVVPSVQRVEPPLVGQLGVQSRASQNARFASFTGDISPPAMLTRVVDISDPQWRPALCWVYQGQCQQSMQFDVDSQAFLQFTPAIWLAGDSNEQVQLTWQTWDTASGWQTLPGSDSAAPFSTSIDPDSIPTAVPNVFPHALTLPFTLPNDESAMQGLLFASRSVDVNGEILVLRSQPILITLFRTP